jgi:hypothetical protein
VHRSFFKSILRMPKNPKRFQINGEYEKPDRRSARSRSRNASSPRFFRRWRAKQSNRQCLRWAIRERARLL